MTKKQLQKQTSITESESCSVLLARMTNESVFWKFSNLYAAICICIYFASASLHYQYVSILTKAFPIWILAGSLYYRKYDNQQYVKLLQKGLIISSLGDIALEFDDNFGSNTDIFFICGLASFLTAHFFYIFSFLKVPGKLSIFLIIPIILIYVILLIVLLPGVEAPLILPVMVYGAALAAMVYLAASKALSKNVKASKRSNGSNNMRLIGALIFFVSDTILAVNKFTIPIPSHKIIVMITYYSAQMFIANSAY